MPDAVVASAETVPVKFRVCVPSTNWNVNVVPLIVPVKVAVVAHEVPDKLTFPDTVDPDSCNVPVPVITRLVNTVDWVVNRHVPVTSTDAT